MGGYLSTHLKNCPCFKQNLRCLLSKAVNPSTEYFDKIFINIHHVWMLPTTYWFEDKINIVKGHCFHILPLVLWSRKMDEPHCQLLSWRKKYEEDTLHRSHGWVAPKTSNLICRLSNLQTEQCNSIILSPKITRTCKVLSSKMEPQSVIFHSQCEQGRPNNSLVWVILFLFLGHTS